MQALFEKNKEFFGVVSGYPGSGKSRILIEMIVNLIQSVDLKKKKEIKILVTGKTANINDLALQLCAMQNNDDLDAGNDWLCAMKKRKKPFIF